MSAIILEIRLEEFEDFPIRLSEAELMVRGPYIVTTLDVSHFAEEHGADLDAYLEQVESTIARSKFRMQYQVVVKNISPPELIVDLSRIRFSSVNFENTDMQGCWLSGSLALNRCLVHESLPPLTVEPGEVFRYPPAKAAKELNITDPKDLFVLRWGLTQDARHLGQAFLWLERRYPATERVLARLLKGLPARPTPKRPWSP